MAVEPNPVFPHIVRDPRVHGGEPTIAGTRVPVRALAMASREQPDVDYLCSAYPSLTPALIDEALAFYEKHQAEIDGLIAANEANLD